MDISGGVIPGQFSALDDTVANLTGGLFQGTVRAGHNGTINVAGGEFSELFLVWNTAAIDLRLRNEEAVRRMEARRREAAAASEENVADQDSI